MAKRWTGVENEMVSDRPSYSPLRLIAPPAGAECNVERVAGGHAEKISRLRTQIEQLMFVGVPPIDYAYSFPRCESVVVEAYTRRLSYYLLVPIVQKKVDFDKPISNEG